MPKRSILFFVIFLSLILVACGNNGSVSASSGKTNNVGASIAATSSATPSTTSTKKVDIVDKYILQIPDEFSVHEVLTSSITTVPTYDIESPTGQSFIIFVYPYMASPSPIPGNCVVSTAFNAGTVSAPVFCEGLDLTSSFTTPSNWIVKYGYTVDDLTQSCTMNSPCPENVPPETRYLYSYVFIIPDKPRAITLDFYVSDAFRNSSNEIKGFQGLGAVLHDLIIPSLSVRNP